VSQQLRSRGSSQIKNSLLLSRFTRRRNIAESVIPSTSSVSIGISITADTSETRNSFDVEPVIRRFEKILDPLAEMRVLIDV
jgi:hypothetical protein